MFEVGKTYKTRAGDDVEIVYILDQGETSIGSRKVFSMVGVLTSLTSGKRIVKYCLNGDYYIGRGKSNHDLIPPKPPLKLKVGAFYKDNHNNLRVLLIGSYSFRAPRVDNFNIYDRTLIDSKTFKSMDGEFQLVKEVSQEEVFQMMY